VISGFTFPNDIRQTFNHPDLTVGEMLNKKGIFVNYIIYKFVIIRQRDGSGTAKKLDEPISTAPSGPFFLQQSIF